ncbi:Hypothetical protein HDN1F_25230 [gamma proteobacterium HdN1]|nr:Hypothetical protein HDN1F_25230 [gamma proteobacterium HdN1]
MKDRAKTAGSSSTRLKRILYTASGLLLLAPVYFTWSGLNPTPIQPLAQQALGPFTATPTPMDELPPYPQGNGFRKDYSVVFCDDCTQHIRVAHLAIQPNAPTLPENEDGILHGSRYLQHVHATAPAQVVSEDRLWLTIQDWKGQVWQTSWPVSSAGD